MLYAVETVVSLILVPVLIVLLGFVLILLIAKRRKTDTLAMLAFQLQTLIKMCEADEPDIKAVKKADTAAGKCELLSDRASFEQKLDIGGVGESVARARRILHAMNAAKVSGKSAKKYYEKVLAELLPSYEFLINTLGITAAPPTPSLKFFSKNMRSENARQYLDSVVSDSHKNEE